MPEQGSSSAELRSTPEVLQGQEVDMVIQGIWLQLIAGQPLRFQASPIACL
jgi:hypothetical protein